MASEISLRDLTSSTLNENLQNHNSVGFKLVKTVADFTQQLSEIHERQAEDLQLLVESFRKRNAEIRKERSSYQSGLFSLWEQLLQEVEVDSQIHGDISRNLSYNLGTGLLEKTFHRKIQSRKVFLYRESLEAILNKADELVKKCYQDYCNAHRKLLLTRNQNQLGEYYEAHNAYVQQLHAANGMLQSYQTHSLPRLLQELEEIYVDISDTISNALQSSADFMSNKNREQANHYENISGNCRSLNTKADLLNFIKKFNPERVNSLCKLHQFIPPKLEDSDLNFQLPEISAEQANWPLLQDEISLEILSKPAIITKREKLKQEVQALEVKILQLEESIDSLVKLQQRSLDSNLFNKANEIQEDISQKRFDLHVANIHLAAVKSQLDLFDVKEMEFLGENSISEKQRERKSSTASTVSMKTRWLKAFKTLKHGSTFLNIDKAEFEDKKVFKIQRRDETNLKLHFTEVQHVFQEYTYKKITPCDVCREILRGHSRQGLKCKLCKINVHSGKCQENAQRCQPKPRLLRRQKSTSEIEMKLSALDFDEEKSHTPYSIDPVYQLLKQAVEAKRTPDSSQTSISTGFTEKWPNQMSQSHVPNQYPTTRTRWSGSSSSSASSYLLSVNPSQHSSSSAPHSPQRKKLNLRMKSFSLDSPESTEHVQKRRTYPSSNPAAHHQSPQSPQSQPRQILACKNIRMSSVELPDNNEKSSASPSPCPSPKPQRLLPTNLYVVLYNFRSRHPDELDLKAGYTVTVTDTSDPDWWQGKCMGKPGFFPSKYVTKLFPGEKPLQLCHTIQVSDGDVTVKLLRDQIVIQVSDEVDGLTMIRTGTGDRTLSCPIKYLQEI